MERHTRVPESPSIYVGAELGLGRSRTSCCPYADSDTRVTPSLSADIAFSPPRAGIRGAKSKRTQCSFSTEAPTRASACLRKEVKSMNCGCATSAHGMHHDSQQSSGVRCQLSGFCRISASNPTKEEPSDCGRLERTLRFFVVAWRKLERSGKGTTSLSSVVIEQANFRIVRRLPFN